MENTLRMSKNDKELIAHISESGEVQTVKEHSLSTANFAQASLQQVGLGSTGKVAGLVHDLGKGKRDYQEYIIASAAGLPVRRGSVIHTFAGVYYMLTSYTDGMEKLAAELIAYAVGSHHGNFDIIDEHYDNGFTHRLTKQPEKEEEAIGNIGQIFDVQDFNSLFAEAVIEVEAVYNRISSISKDQTEAYFYLGLVARLLSSAVIDGDRKDTAQFMNGANFDDLHTGSRKLWEEVGNSIVSFIDKFDQTTEIQKARREISDICEAFAIEKGGIYRLNAPTGGAKTLAALRYSVTHAKHHDKKRVIYTAPMLSILEQNTDAIRSAVNDNTLVLEHHSNVILPQNEEDLAKYEMLAETWDSPIIATTLAQLLNALFSGKTTSIRRFHSLCNSVIIIDEIQQAPQNMLHLINLAVNFLSEICNATVVICSATQPTLQKMEYRMNISGTEMISEEDFERFQKIFKRTKLVDKGRMKLADLPGMILDLVAEEKSVLTVCNTKKSARTLFSMLKEHDVTCFHLSASMCPAHRRRVIKNIRNALSNNEKVVCISTQVIEAGVDISFDTAIRLAAGMDNAVQTAGRVSRNGECGSIAEVYIVNCADENLGPLADIKNAQTATNDLLTCFKESPERFDNDLCSEKAIEYFYDKLYSQLPQGHFDLKKDGHDDILTLLSTGPSKGGRDEEKYYLRQAFKTAGELFEVFDNSSRAVIVPYGRGSKLIADLCSAKASEDFSYTKKLLSEANDYTVSIYEYQYKKLLKDGAIREILDGSVLVLNEGWYGDEGLLEKEDQNTCDILMK